MSQDQFLDVIDRDEAERRFRAAIDCRPLGREQVSLEQSLGRVLAADVLAEVDVPSFDRSNYDGYALRAADTYAAREESPRRPINLQDSLKIIPDRRWPLTPCSGLAITSARKDNPIRRGNIMISW